MIRRSLNLAGHHLAGHHLTGHDQQFADGSLPLPMGFTNPWAECWGSNTQGLCAQAPIQMQADASSMHHQQMQAGSQADDNRSGGDQGEPCEEPVTAPAPSTEGGVVRILPIINNKGLHARASAKFVQTVEGFDATVRVTRCGETVGGQSIMGLMMLAAARGTTITVETSGQQALPCMDALEALLASKFGEEA